MTHCVIDASVVAVAILQEPNADLAEAVLDRQGPLRAPDLIFTEFANAAWKRALRGEITHDQATRLLADVLDLPLEITRSVELAPHALELACQTRRTVYDCLYLALAIRTNSVLITADKRLVNALARGPLARYITLLDKLS